MFDTLDRDDREMREWDQAERMVQEEFDRRTVDFFKNIHNELRHKGEAV